MTKCLIVSILMSINKEIPNLIIGLAVGGLVVSNILERRRRAKARQSKTRKLLELNSRIDEALSLTSSPRFTQVAGEVEANRRDRIIDGIESRINLLEQKFQEPRETLLTAEEQEAAQTRRLRGYLAVSRQESLIASLTKSIGERIDEEMQRPIIDNTITTLSPDGSLVVQPFRATALELDLMEATPVESGADINGASAINEKPVIQGANREVAERGEKGSRRWSIGASKRPGAVLGAAAAVMFALTAWQAWPKISSAAENVSSHIASTVKKIGETPEATPIAYIKASPEAAKGPMYETFTVEEPRTSRDLAKEKLLKSSPYAKEYFSRMLQIQTASLSEKQLKELIQDFEATGYSDKKLVFYEAMRAMLTLYPDFETELRLVEELLVQANGDALERTSPIIFKPGQNYKEQTDEMNEEYLRRKMLGMRAGTRPSMSVRQPDAPEKIKIQEPTEEGIKVIISNTPTSLPAERESQE